MELRLGSCAHCTRRLGHEGAAQIFGEPPEKGHDIIWDVENGLPMRYDMRRDSIRGESALQPVRDEMDPMGFVTNEMDHTGPIFLLFNKEIGGPENEL
jgi:hypothetical protein